MRRFALLSSAAAPVLLIGGWTLAASLQPAGFDPVTDTISALAAVDAADRQVMTVAFVGTGLAHLVTALGLTEVARSGRLLLALGGLATLLVAAFPLPATGSSTGHALSAAVAFGALAAWPLLAASRAPGTPLALQPGVRILAGLVLLGLIAWFAVTLRTGGPVGLAERIAAGAQAIWPLVVTVNLRSHISHRHPV